jgi:hypothetical protein
MHSFEHILSLLALLSPQLTETMHGVFREIALAALYEMCGFLLALVPMGKRGGNTLYHALY